ncbi:MAG: hypothetical protein FWC36_05485 [Spirochaetes bacterium]|nr:hypothetical protein [Spirochaetota bacterium]
MKKHIVFLNIFLFFVILVPIFGMDLKPSEYKIDNISPPDWILGSWVLEESADLPAIEFTENNIIIDYSLEDDIFFGYVVAFIQERTASYYDIYVKFDDGEWSRERFFIPANGVMKSQFTASDGSNFSLTYHRN